jgi:hypothetical protein
MVLFYYRFYDHQPGFHMTFSKPGDLTIKQFLDGMSGLLKHRGIKRSFVFLITPDPDTNNTKNKKVALKEEDLIHEKAYIEIWY